MGALTFAISAMWTTTQNVARTGSEEWDDQAPPVVDRRDRIYYPDDTERPKPFLRKLFLNIVLDQKDIFMSPFRVNQHNAMQWLLPMAVTGALIASVTHIANAFEKLPIAAIRKYDRKMHRVSSRKAQGKPIFVCLCAGWPARRCFIVPDHGEIAGNR